jgi:hypothetical protein
MNYLINVLAACNGLALLLVLIMLLRGPFRKFWIVLFYVAGELTAQLTLTILGVLYNAPVQVDNSAAHVAAMKWYARAYWGSDIILDLFRFILVIVLTYKATAPGAKKVPMGWVLGGVITFTMLLPFLLFPMGPNPWPRGEWFNSTSQLLNFGGAIMNLGLWAALIANRQRDRQFVAVSVGLGVVVTGTALSYGLRHFISPENRALPDLFLMLVQLVAWTVWCLAFWPARARSMATTNKAMQSM